MKFPDLEPELASAMQKAISELDNSASVAFAHLFLKIGDDDALREYDDMTFANPDATAMLGERYLSPPPDLDALAALPEGTLGRAFARYMHDNELDPKLLRESAFIEAHHKRGDEIGYLTERGFQLHDMFHVLTGYDTSPLGEIRVVSFTVAQTPSPYPALVIATRVMQASLHKPQFLPPLLDAVAEGWSLGRRAKSLIPVRWEDHWEAPLTELRAEYDLLPAA
jgi:ubiquinone biosynthesis protein Coq4